MKSTANAPTARKFIHRKPKAQRFAWLRLEAYEQGSVRGVHVQAGSVAMTLDPKETKRLIQWMHRFERWDTERKIAEQRKAQEE